MFEGAAIERLRGARRRHAVFEIEVEGTFEQSPDHVFDLADFRNLPGWNQDVLSTEKTSPGPVSV